MDVDILVTKKLKNDLLEYFSDYSDNDSLEELIDLKIKENPITIDNLVDPVKIIDDKERCCARVMGERYSDNRCTYKSQKDSDYCKNHSKRIDNYGYLAFRRYDEERPLINEKSNKIPWRDTTAMEDINTVIQYQNMKLCKLIQ